MSETLVVDNGALATHMLNVAALLADGSTAHLAGPKARRLNSPTVSAEPKARFRQRRPLQEADPHTRESYPRNRLRFRSRLCESIT